MSRKITTAIILAAGSGIRMKKSRPKQFLPVGDKPLVLYSLEKFDKNDNITHIVIVSMDSHKEEIEKIVKNYHIDKVYKIVQGGDTRQESSFEGVKNCPPGTEFALIHDAARPFITDKIINDVLEGALKTGAAGPAIKSGDTIVINKKDFIDKIPDRESVKRIQTPQAFKYSTILKAHNFCLKHNISSSTDDCGMVLAMGKKVKLVEGSQLNIKITTSMDMRIAETIAKAKTVLV